MGTILNDADRALICRRIGSVTDASAARWGKMDAASMLVHLKRSALMTLGELPVANKSKRLFQVFPLKHLLLHLAPFPRGAPTAPELLPSDPPPIDVIRTELISLIERIAAGPRVGDGPVHPLFGRLTYPEWGVATYKHADHHLRQFGA